MEKKVLIAVDGSIYSRKALEYAVQMSGIIKNMSFILLNIQPKISEFLINDAEMDTKSRSSLKDVVKKNQEASVNILDEAKSIMVRMGLDESVIETVSRPETRGTAKGILDYGNQSLCDAIIIGRKGLTKLAEAFLGSVANTVLEYTSTTPVWAVGGEADPLKIMVAIDGSESSLRTVDHVSYMVGDNPDVKISFLHVTPRLRDYCTIDFDEEGDIIEDVITQGDKRCVDSFYLHAQERFKEGGLQENQIEINEVQSTISLGKTIVDQAKKENFGTIVIGRRGANNSFFMGSVSRHILSNAANRAVWLVP